MIMITLAKVLIRSSSLAFVLATMGCAGKQPTPMLEEARDQYQTAASGPAAKYVPDMLYEARVALQKAEAAHDRDPGSDQEEHLAYLAHRRTLLATYEAERIAASQAVSEANTQRRTVLLSQLEEAQSDRERTGAALMAEQAKREAAEREARRALEDIAQVKQEENRTILTLSGSMLFASGKATLLPGSRSRLDRVAEALRKMGEGKQILVEGHADASGSNQLNDELSRKRAEAVRSYLAERGVPENTMRAVGKGELEPIADNETAVGRATNRRVEIEIDNASPAGQ
jgi:outer membrane protein OmpA-like peptidoglycan-associated protein